MYGDGMLFGNRDWKGGAFPVVVGAVLAHRYTRPAAHWLTLWQGAVLRIAPPEKA
jgi:hypothetical protein